jgi:hypothetical protein
MRRTPRRLIGTLIAAAALLSVIPASAQANLSLTGSTAKPSDLSAGGHSDFKIHVALPGTDDVKDLTISLPPGEVGNPQATPLCNPSQLPNCPSNTAVGSVSSSVTIASLLPQTITGTVFNLVPQPGEPARFGIVLNALPISLPPPLNGLILPPTVVQSGASLRQSDFGLDTVVNNVPNTAALSGGAPLTVPVHINSMDLTLDGVIPGSGNPFMRNPTSCDDHEVGFAADSYSSTNAMAEDHFTPTDCGALDFSPAFTAIVGGPGGTAQGRQTTAITSIDQDNDEAGLINAHVFVPPDLAPNTLTDLLSHRCPPADFESGTCLGNTVVGDAVATSPLLSSPLAGQVLLVDDGGLLPNIGLDLRGQLHLLLQGSLNPDKSVIFAGLPDIPIAHFQLAFTNPPGLLIANRDLCVGSPPVFHADFTGYNGASTSVDSTATVQGCGGGSGGTAVKCTKKAKKKHKHHAAESKKHKKKHSCKKKHKKRR